MDNQTTNVDAQQLTPKPEYVFVNVPAALTRECKIDGAPEGALNFILPRGTIVDGFMPSPDGSSQQQVFGVDVGGGSFYCAYPYVTDKDGNAREMFGARLIKDGTVSVSYRASGSDEYSRVLVNSEHLSKSVKKALRDANIRIDIPNNQRTPIKEYTAKATGEQFRRVQLPYPTMLNINGETINASQASFGLTRGMRILPATESSRVTSIVIPKSYEINLSVPVRKDDGEIVCDAEGKWVTKDIKITPEILKQGMDELRESQRAFAAAQQAEQVQEQLESSPSLNDAVAAVSQQEQSAPSPSVAAGIEY